MNQAFSMQVAQLIEASWDLHRATWVRRYSTFKPHQQSPHAKCKLDHQLGNELTLLVSQNQTCFQQEPTKGPSVWKAARFAAGAPTAINAGDLQESGKDQENLGEGKRPQLLRRRKGASQR